MLLTKAGFVGVLVAVLGVPVSAAAQSAPSAHDISVTFGAGVSTELGDWGGSHGTWALGARYGLSPHFAVDLDLGRWSDRRVYDDMLDWEFENGVYEPARRVLVEEQTQWHGAVMLVARTRPRRVSASGGLGVAYFYQTGKSSFAATRLSDQRLDQPAHDWTWTTNGVGLVGKAGVDVRVTSRVGLFVEGRGSLGMVVDTILLGAHAGVRVAF